MSPAPSLAARTHVTFVPGDPGRAARLALWSAPSDPAGSWSPADDSIEVIREGEMPPAYFTRFGLHSDANLSEAEITELVAGLQATPGFEDD